MADAEGDHPPAHALNVKNQVGSNEQGTSLEGWGYGIRCLACARGRRPLAVCRRLLDVSRIFRISVLSPASRFLLCRSSHPVGPDAASAKALLQFITVASDAAGQAGRRSSVRRPR